jgi:hypothetical protein
MRVGFIMSLSGVSSRMRSKDSLPMTKTVDKGNILKKVLTSFLLSIVLVGVLLGNAYMTTSIDYPAFIQPVGIALTVIGYVAVIFPVIIYSGLAGLGVVPELRGRESFIRLNTALWIFCVIFYTLAFYLRLRYWPRKPKDSSKGSSLDIRH